MARLLTTTADLVRHSMNIEVSVAIDADDEGLVALADQNQLQQVLVNLSLNARDAMPPGATQPLEFRLRFIACSSVNCPHFRRTCRPAIMWFSTSRTAGPACPPTCSPGSSTRSSRPRTSARGPAWACPSPPASCTAIKDCSRSSPTSARDVREHLSAAARRTGDVTALISGTHVLEPEATPPADPGRGR